jgi:hypothetical protein
MKRLNRVASLVSATALVLGTASAAFAAQQSGLVNVNIQDVAQNIARDINVNVSQIPVTVQVPVGVAANVCGIDANVLAKQQQTGDANCKAKTTSEALNQVVQKQVGSQKTGK